MKTHNHLIFIIVKFILINSKNDQLINLNESNKIFSNSAYIISLCFVTLLLVYKRTGWFSVQNLRKNQGIAVMEDQSNMADVGSVDLRKKETRQ